MLTFLLASSQENLADPWGLRSHAGGAVTGTQRWKDPQQLLNPDSGHAHEPRVQPLLINGICTSPERACSLTGSSR